VILIADAEFALVIIIGIVCDSGILLCGFILHLPFLLIVGREIEVDQCVMLSRVLDSFFIGETS